MKEEEIEALTEGQPTAVMDLSERAKERLEEAESNAKGTDEVQDGIFIAKYKSENGDISTDTVTVGNVELTEVQTLIELGLRGWRAKIGLDGN